MVTEGINLMVCFATKETGGNSGDDFMMLDNHIQVTVSPGVEPARVVKSSSQQLTVSYGTWGARIAFTATINGVADCKCVDNNDGQTVS